MYINIRSMYESSGNRARAIVLRRNRVCVLRVGTRRDDPRDPPDFDRRCRSTVLMVDASNEVLRCAYCRACEESDADIDEQGAGDVNSKL